MIEKMKFLSITGPRDDIDRVVSEYFSKYEIQLENALSELQTVKNLRPFSEINPYKEWMDHISEVLELIGDLDKETPAGSISAETALEIIRDADKKLEEYSGKKAELDKLREQKEQLLKQLEPFREFPYSLEEVMEFEYIKFRFGKIEKLYLPKLRSYINQEIDTIFYVCNSDEHYVWGVYFVPETQVRRVDVVFASLHFERIFLPNEYKGIPEKVYEQLSDEISEIDKKLKQEKKHICDMLGHEEKELLLAREKISRMQVSFDVRKMAACTAGDEKDPVYYILCGWMSGSDTEKFLKEIETDDRVQCMVEDPDGDTVHQPPTKLKNPKLFRPFEMFVRMYGLPEYREIDPTIFVALTYAFIFGVMFGDVGQGLCLVIGGCLLYRKKQMDLAACIGTAGIFSVVFGFMYGSIFGFEDIIPAMWLRPKEAMTQLPFIGSLNTVFVVAVAFGMGLILLTMIFHMINAVKASDVQAGIFDTNGIAGLVFYGTVVLVIVLFMTGHALPAAGVLTVMFVIPLIMIAFQEPLAKLVKKRANAMPENKGMFLLTSFFELFEVLLSYFSNTLSFVRIGAFAVSHAAMMEVVLMLAGYEQGGMAGVNWVVIILGNCFVSLMEGLIVGIQVLRLEYYEMFSRFYKGNGREFKPFKNHR